MSDPSVELKPRWLSVTDAKRYASMSRKEILALVKEGEFKASVIPGGRKIRIDRLSIDAYFERNPVNADSAFIEETVGKLTGKL